MFDVVPDFDRRMLRITLRGFWDGAVMADYMRVVQRAMSDLRRTGGCKYILINMIDFPIQPKEIAKGHADNLRVVKQTSSTRVALVMQSALSKLQAARVAADTGHHSFSTEQDAEAWLFSDT